MLNITPHNLAQEVTHALEVNKQVTYLYPEMIKEFHGKHWRSGRGPATPLLENSIFEMLDTTRPRVVFDNPSVAVTMERSGTPRASGDAMRAGINRTCKLTALWRQLDIILHDTVIGPFGVAHVIDTAMPGWEGASTADELTPGLPRCRRIRPDWFFMDPDCDDFQSARYLGHVYRLDLEDAVRDDRYDRAYLTDLADKNPTSDAKRWRYEEDTPNRKQIYLAEVWVPEHRLADAPRESNGTLFTVPVGSGTSSVDDGSTRYPRRPRPYRGPRWGPYEVFGEVRIPNSPYPASRLQVMREAILNRNAADMAAWKKAKKHKRIVAVSGSHPKDADTIRETPDDNVVLIGSDAKVTELELGGITEQLQMWAASMAERVDRALRLSDPVRGATNAEKTTATEVQIAAEQHNEKTAMIERDFKAATQMVLNRFAWHLFHGPDKVFALDQETANQFVPRPSDLPAESEAGRVKDDMADVLDAMGVEDRDGFVRDALDHRPAVSFAGGEQPEVINRVARDEYLVGPNVPGVRFEDLGVTIEPHSMERVNQAVLMRRTTDMIQLLVEALPTLRELPEVEVRALINRMGDAINQPDLAEELIDGETYDQMRQAQRAMLQQPAEPEPGPSGQAGGRDPQRRQDAAAPRELTGPQEAAAL